MKDSFLVFYQEVKEKEEEEEEEEEDEEFGYKIAGSLKTINYGGTLIRTLNSKKIFFLLKARLLLLQGPQLLDAMINISHFFFSIHIVR